jgi:site-specific recombinase XerD
VKRYLSLVATFSRYAAQMGCARVEDIDTTLIERFLGHLPVSAGTRAQAKTAIGHTMRCLGRRDPYAAERTDIHESDAPLLTGFDTYMRDLRGLRRRSREDVLRLVRRLLAWHREHRPGQPIATLGGADVLTFVSRVATTCVASSTRSGALSHVRGFLRYLRWAGVLDADLAPLVPQVPCWRLARIPPHLEWSEVRAMIDAVDTSDAMGKRDRAILLLLATTGLRSQEVRQLELRNVHWRTGVLHVRRTKSRRERVVPLLHEAGAALADYVLHGRPRVTAEARVFLRQVPPFDALRSSSTLAVIVRRRLARCGIRPPRGGAHLLRHSVATRMVQQERPVKEVADLLGHRSIDTTAIYIKVGVSQLQDVALPFPGGVA